MSERKYLVVVDPARQVHRSIDWIVQIAQQKREETMQVHLLIGVETGDVSDDDAPDEVTKDVAWFEELVQPLEEAGLEFDAEVAWTSKWRDSVLDSAKRNNCDIIMMARSAAEHQEGVIADSKWGLLRRSPVPVAIISRETNAKIHSILAAVDMQDQDEHSIRMNEGVLKVAHELAGYYEADLHVINAYKDAEDFPDRGAVQRVIDLPRENIHRDLGKPEDIVAEFVDKLGSDLVVIGTHARKGFAAALKGNTSEKVIDNIHTDVLVLNRDYGKNDD